METPSKFQERRNSVRLKMIYPAIYTRYDNKGRAYDEKPSRSVNISLGGMRLQSSFPVSTKEVLDIAVALADSLVSFKGEVIYVNHSQEEVFELGISIKEIRNLDRIALDRLQSRSEDSYELQGDHMVIKKGQIVCPNCGRQIASLSKIKAMTNYCKEFVSLCGCGQRFEIRISSSGAANLSFPDKQIELIC